jgi:hypothetical protein
MAMEAEDTYGMCTNQRTWKLLIWVPRIQDDIEASVPEGLERGYCLNFRRFYTISKVILKMAIGMV